MAYFDIIWKHCIIACKIIFMEDTIMFKMKVVVISETDGISREYDSVNKIERFSSYYVEKNGKWGIISRLFT